jgi:hypothetical protein
MTGRILNRRELRQQPQEADQAVVVAPDAAPAAGPATKRRAKAPAAPRARKPRKPKQAPRLRVRWAVFDGSMKQVAIFDYNQRTAADDKLAELNTKKKGAYFLQIVKEPMPEPAEAVATEEPTGTHNAMAGSFAPAPSFPARVG